MKKIPGTFKAHCRLGHGTDTPDFDQPGLFEAHMLEAHGAKPGMCAKRALLKNGVRGPITGFTTLRLRPQLRLGKGLWKGSRLTEEGETFEPEGLEPGATVTWRELVGTGEFSETVEWGRRERQEWVERSGQVWCAGWRPRSAWVVPFEPLEGEQAVMVEQRSNGELEHYSTQTSPSKAAA